MLKDKLKELRKRANYTQEQVAEKIGTTPVAYSRYETGKRIPPLEVLSDLADLYDVPVDYIIGRKRVTSETLTEYEKDLIEDFRKADNRAREDAADILKNHKADELR